MPLGSVIPLMPNHNAWPSVTSGKARVRYQESCAWKGCSGSPVRTSQYDAYAAGPSNGTRLKSTPFVRRSGGSDHASTKRAGTRRIPTLLVSEASRPAAADWGQARWRAHQKHSAEVSKNRDSLYGVRKKK